MLLCYEEFNNKLKYEARNKNTKLDHYFKHEYRKKLK